MLNDSKLLLTKSLLLSTDFIGKVYRLKKLNKKVKRVYFYRWMKGVWKCKSRWVITRSYCVNKLNWYFSKKGFVKKQFKTKAKPETYLYTNNIVFRLKSICNWY